MLETEEWLVIGFSIFVVVIRLAHFLHQRCVTKSGPTLVQTGNDECGGVRLLSWRPLENWEFPEPVGPHTSEPDEDEEDGEDMAPPSYSSLQLDLPPPYPKDCIPADSESQDELPPPSYSEICFSLHHPPHRHCPEVPSHPPPSPPSPSPPYYPSTASVELPSTPTLRLVHMEVTRL